ncbi:serine racemase-like isoform X1 [Amphiura filiformis]|uniref:serine racemase-like isoform X1 n=1 Tax=Amphiura filiformis TaxID=82378 RepID=UPI003B21BED3
MPDYDFVVGTVTGFVTGIIFLYLTTKMSKSKENARCVSTSRNQLKQNGNLKLPNDSKLLKQPVSIQDVQDAAKRIQNYVHRTPVMTSRRVDKMAGRNLFFKCEVLQRTGSFKIRGATNAVCKLMEKHSDGSYPCVVTHSSGNHGQSLACAAHQVGLKAYVVLPKIAPLCKQKAIEEYGAVKILCEPSEQDREAQKDKIVETNGAVYIPSSEHYDVIAGQGTIASELLEQVLDENNNPLDAIVVPIGGGGMLAGICVAAKSLQPGIKVIAAEPKLADDCYQSFHAGTRLPLPKYPDTVADGLKINMGPVAWPIIKDLVDDVIVVGEDEIKEATKLVWNTMKLCIEPSAGVGVAAVLSDQFQKEGSNLKNVGVILCGGNVDLGAVSSWIA